MPDKTGPNHKQPSKTFRKKKEAEAWLDDYSTDQRKGRVREIIPATFEEYSKIWKPKYLIPEELKPSTLNAYNSMLQKHLVKHFGPLGEHALGHMYVGGHCTIEGSRP
jgi:hypothetical protein